MAAAGHYHFDGRAGGAGTGLLWRHKAPLAAAGRAARGRRSLRGADVRRALSPAMVVEHAATKEEAMLRLEEHGHYALALVDLQLGSDRSAGLDVLAAAAALRPTMTRALVTGAYTPDLPNRAT